MIHLAPGDPTSLYWSDDTDPEVLRLMQHNLGLDKPLPEQYARWIASSFRGEFGYSFGHLFLIGRNHLYASQHFFLAG